ncbi:MAG: hypothetical protein ACJZ2K_06175 [Candidatus Poseidoniaceae archaeon]
MYPFDTEEIQQEEEEEIDPFEELQIGSRPSSQNDGSASGKFDAQDDLLAAFSDDEDDEMEEVVLSFEEANVPAIETAAPTTNNSSEATYKLLLETVWVDDILDPSEVELLARKRGELGLSFERHLQLVRDIIGG